MLIIRKFVYLILEENQKKIVEVTDPKCFGTCSLNYCWNNARKI